MKQNRFLVAVLCLAGIASFAQQPGNAPYLDPISENDSSAHRELACEAIFAASKGSVCVQARAARSASRSVWMTFRNPRWKSALAADNLWLICRA